jgi:hypothetical protein
MKALKKITFEEERKLKSEPKEPSKPLSEEGEA